MIETRSASTALNKHKGLQQFFKWLVAEEEMDRSPDGAGAAAEDAAKKLIPVMRDDETKKLLTPARARASSSCATRR